MIIQVASLYDLDETTRVFLQGVYDSTHTVILTSEKRPRLVVMPYERYRILAERLADLADVLRELTQTVIEAESQHPYHELKEELIAEGVLDAD